MAVANHPLCEPVRFAHYKALVPIREVDGIVYVSGHGPEDINTYEPLYRGRVGTDLTLEDGYNAAAECAKTLLRAVQQRYGSLDWHPPSGARHRAGELRRRFYPT